MSRLMSLKIAQLRPLLTAIGSKTSGTKSDLTAVLDKEVCVPKLALKEKTTRLLSVDMGIRNLAFCVCDVKKGKQGIGMEVMAWKRIAVADGAARGAKGEDPFAPPGLSKTAYSLVKDVLLPYSPDTVLIERQRFRSGGGSAVQEWTLRVNMLEGMIWAIFTALRGLKGSPELWAVSPKQVAGFWVAGHEDDEVKDAKIGRSKIEKKQKIDLVAKWLDAGTHDYNISLDFVGQAAKTKASFTAAVNKKSTVPAVKVSTIDKDGQRQEATEKISKLDDLADCLLQAAAWCKWEENKTSLAPLVKEGDEEKMIAWLEGRA